MAGLRRAPIIRLIISFAFGILGAFLAHRCIERDYDRSSGVSFGTMYLNELLDRPARKIDRNIDLGLPDDYETNPATRQFCKRIIDRVQPYRVNREANYDVWAVQMGKPTPTGWPFVSNNIFARFVIEGESSPSSYLYVQQWADPRGESPFIWWAFSCNALFYAAVLMLLFSASVRFTDSIREKRRLRKGLCRSCGYDLRGMAERCPECGHAISNPPMQKETAMRISSPKLPADYP